MRMKRNYGKRIVSLALVSTMVLVSACGAAKTATPSPSATPEAKKEVKTDVTITVMAQPTQATKALTESFKRAEDLKRELKSNWIRIRMINF